jgi:hypothetical protein
VSVQVPVTDHTPTDLSERSDCLASLTVATTVKVPAELKICVGIGSLDV